MHVAQRRRQQGRFVHGSPLLVPPSFISHRSRQNHITFTPKNASSGGLVWSILSFWANSGFVSRAAFSTLNSERGAPACKGRAGAYIRQRGKPPCLIPSSMPTTASPVALAPMPARWTVIEVDEVATVVDADSCVGCGACQDALPRRCHHRNRRGLTRDLLAEWLAAGPMPSDWPLSFASVRGAFAYAHVRVTRHRQAYHRQGRRMSNACTLFWLFTPHGRTGPGTQPARTNPTWASDFGTL